MIKLDCHANYTFTERKGDNAIRIPKHRLMPHWVMNFQKKPMHP